MTSNGSKVEEKAIIIHTNRAKAISLFAIIISGHGFFHKFALWDPEVVSKLSYTNRRFDHRPGTSPTHPERVQHGRSFTGRALPLPLSATQHYHWMFSFTERAEWFQNILSDLSFRKVRNWSGSNWRDKRSRPILGLLLIKIVASISWNIWSHCTWALSLRFWNHKDFPCPFLYFFLYSWVQTSIKFSKS